MPFVKKYLNAIDLTGHELQNAIAHQLASDPIGKPNGYWYYNTTAGEFRFLQGGSFSPMAGEDAITALIDDPDPTMAAPLKTAQHGIRESIGANVPSAASVTLGADGNYFNITGTVNISGMAGIQVGMRVELTFVGILDLIHNAVSFILPSATNITTAAGDVAVFREISAGNWKCTSYTRADGTPLVGGGGSSQPFSDATAHIKDAADDTKLIRFDAGAIATGNTRVLQAPNTDGKLALIPIERQFYSGATTIGNGNVLKVMTVRHPLKVVSLEGEVETPGDVPVEIRLRKNGVVQGTTVSIGSPAATGNNDYGIGAQANIVYAAGDVMEILVEEDGDDSASGGTPAQGPLDVLVMVCYDPD